MRFGNMVVTHTTTNPYKVTYLFLSFALAQCVMFIFTANVTYKGNFNEFIKFWIDNSLYEAVFFTFELCKCTAIMLFLNVQTFDNQILYYFVTF